MIEKFRSYSSSYNGMTWVSHPDKRDITDKIEEIIDHVNDIEKDMKLVIIKFDPDKYGPEEVHEFYRKMWSDKKVLVVPKDMDILLNCSTAELVSIRDKIDDLIREKEIIDEM